jgi:hypothetical protein
VYTKAAEMRFPPAIKAYRRADHIRNQTVREELYKFDIQLEWLMER